MAKKSVRMLRNMGRYKRGDIYTNVPEWCRQLVAVGFAEEIDDESPPPPPALVADDDRPRRTRRRAPSTLDSE